jgi:hypothetical protein
VIKYDDKLNLSVDVTTIGKKGSNQNGSDLGSGNLRLSRITEEKLNNSVDGISSSKGNISSLTYKI